jgi:hypothetical protein
MLDNRISICYLWLQMEEGQMAKKQAQFRFEEDFYSNIHSLAEAEGLSVTEIVRNALALYGVLYERTKGKKVRFYLEDDENNKCEVILPWLHWKSR